MIGHQRIKPVALHESRLFSWRGRDRYLPLVICRSLRNSSTYLVIWTPNELSGRCEWLRGIGYLPFTPSRPNTLIRVDILPMMLHLSCIFEWWQPLNVNYVAYAKTRNSIPLWPTERVGFVLMQQRELFFLTAVSFCGSQFGWALPCWMRCACFSNPGTSVDLLVVPESLCRLRTNVI